MSIVVPLYDTSAFNIKLAISSRIESVIVAGEIENIDLFCDN